MSRKHSKRRLGEVRHSRSKINRILERDQLHNSGRIMRSLNVKVEIQRNIATIGAGGGFRAQYTALACPISKGKYMPTSATALWNHYKKHGSFPRGRRCGDGYGPTPTKAYQNALKSLAKIKR